MIALFDMFLHYAEIPTFDCIGSCSLFFWARGDTGVNTGQHILQRWKYRFPSKSILHRKYVTQCKYTVSLCVLKALFCHIKTEELRHANKLVFDLTVIWDCVGYHFIHSPVSSVFSLHQHLTKKLSDSLDDKCLDIIHLLVYCVSCLWPAFHIRR